MVLNIVEPDLLMRRVKLPGVVALEVGVTTNSGFFGT